MFLEKGGPNVPVLVFTFVASSGEGRSLFLKVRESFEEMRTILQNKVPPHASCPRMKLNLFISNLGVCDGREVEVDEDAWTTLIAEGKGVISEVLVRVSREDAGKAKQEEDEKENRRPLSVRPLDQPERKSNYQSPEPPSQSTSTSSSPAPHRSSPTPKKARRAEPAAVDLFASDDHVTQPYDDTEDDEESRPRKEYDETDDEENKLPSHSSQGSGRSWEQVHHQITGGADDEETDEDVFKSRQSTKPPKASAPVPVLSKKDVPRSSPKKRSSMLADDLDASYKVTVVGPGPNQRASLAAKGKYPVRKVLNAVCKKFSLTGSASLYIRNDPDDLEVLCLPEQTMAEVGAREGSELIVNLHDDSDDEDEDEDSE